MGTWQPMSHVSFRGNPLPKWCKMYTLTSPRTARPLDYSFSGFRKPRQLPKPVKTWNLFFQVTDVVAWTLTWILLESPRS